MLQPGRAHAFFSVTIFSNARSSSSAPPPRNTKREGSRRDWRGALLVIVVRAVLATMVTHALTVLAFVSNPLIANTMEKLATTILVEVLPLVSILEIPSRTSLRRLVIEKSNTIKIKLAALLEGAPAL